MLRDSFMPMLRLCGHGPARRMLLPVIVGAVALLALACSSGGQPLAGTSWTLLSVGDSPAIGDVEVEFSEDSGISGWTGCNSYDGKYSASGSSFTIDTIEELSWTEAGCPSHELFIQESRYTDLLVDAAGFAVSGSQLTITSSDYQTIRFTPRR